MGVPLGFPSLPRTRKCQTGVRLYVNDCHRNTRCPSSAAASHHAATSLSLELLEARQARDGLATLLRAERTAAAEFLLALADFDRRRGWERLGHASLFAFLHVELGLSKGAAYVRFTAARLLQAFPEVIEPIRSGRLCLSAVGELARVATPENFAVVLPRFFGCSSREAREVAAAVLPRPAPPLRDQVTRLQPVVELRSPSPSARPEAQPSPELASQTAPLELASPVEALAVRAHEPALTHPARDAARRDDVEPLTADLRRLHITVDAQFLKMLDTARDGLSHSIPGASMEQVLKAALELLLEKQARARGLVKRPRKVLATPIPTAIPTSTPTSTAHRRRPRHRLRPHLPRPSSPSRPNLPSTAAPARARPSPPPSRARSGHATAAAARGRSTRAASAARRTGWSSTTSSRGRAGAARRSTTSRIVCSAHNALAARQVFGERCVERYGRAAPSTR